jgi:hypothetical protein
VKPPRPEPSKPFQIGMIPSADEITLVAILMGIAIIALVFTLYY